MGSPLRPTLTNVFLCHHEKTWLQNCPSEFKPVIYRIYVDDTFLIFRSKHHIEKFRNYLNRQRKKIKFTSETENGNSIPFLDIKITRNNNKFMTSVYRWPVFSGFFMIWSHINTTCCYIITRAIQTSLKFWIVFIKKLTSLILSLKITVTPKVLLISVLNKIFREGFYKKESSTKSLAKRTYLRPSFSWKKVNATENSFTKLHRK